MRPEAVFAPVTALSLWTMIVILVTAIRRIGAVRARRVSAGAFRLGESPDVPPDVAVANRNLMNLLEMPLLFYVVSIAFYVTRHVGAGVVGLAWAFVALRVVHSFIHLGSNRPIPRLVSFTLSNLVLLAMWLTFSAALW